jgi:SAM-dependent methyltransferase
MSYRSRNKAAWNHIAERHGPFTKVATDEECQQPLETLDSQNWLPRPVVGLDVLCLAAAGGWQAILYASAGANVTVVDISRAMLNIDEREAARRGLRLRTLEAWMDDLSLLADASFDIVHQPVSTCYVPDVGPVYREVARVLRDGGLYVSQHKQPVSLQIVGRNAREQYVIGIDYYHQGPLPDTSDTMYRERGTTEYLHRLHELMGGLCRAGFVIEDFREPYRADPKAAPGEVGHRGRFVPPYLRLKARRLPRSAEQPSPKAAIWTPG